MSPEQTTVTNSRWGMAGIARFWKYFVTAPLAVACAAGIWYGEPVIVALFAAAALFLCTALLAVGLFILCFSLATRRAWRPPVVLMVIAVVGAGMVVGAVSLNHLVQDRAVLHAKAYPERVAPQLESYRQAHGNYPQSLDQLPAAPRLPRLLRDRAYSSDGRSYSFQFPSPGGFIDVWVYSSETRSWHLST